MSTFATVGAPYLLVLLIVASKQAGLPAFTVLQERWPRRVDLASRAVLCSRADCRHATPARQQVLESVCCCGYVVCASEKVDRTKTWCISLSTATYDALQLQLWSRQRQVQPAQSCAQLQTTPDERCKGVVFACLSLLHFSNRNKRWRGGAEVRMPPGIAIPSVAARASKNGCFNLYSEPGHNPFHHSCCQSPLHRV